MKPLKIEIESDVTKAVEAMERLCASVERLNAAFALLNATTAHGGIDLQMAGMACVIKVKPPK